jgi:pSer/pThr/pTyr-binding forkhead associated (FHA) protein
MPDDRPVPPPDQVAPPWRILFHVGTENRTTVGLQVSAQMLVGRSDAGGDSVPDLDLSPLDGRRSGVSRRHALITYENETLFLTDLNSTNGTRINGFQLTPGRSYRLRDGDELEFGRIRGIMRFVRSLR